MTRKIHPTLAELMDRLAQHVFGPGHADLDLLRSELKRLGYPLSNPTPPSHLIRSQASEALGITRQAVDSRIANGTLPTELHYGEVMIPAWSLLPEIEAKRKA